MSASAGIVLIIPKGEYDGTVTYNMLNLVTYQNGSYLAKQTTTGNLPTDTTYWQEMISTPDMTGASAGAAGTHGLVPAPSAGSQAKFLRGDATWAAVDLSSKADQSIIGGSYNASTAYEPGDRFSYNGVRYKVIIESGTVSGQTPPNALYYEVCSVDDDIVQLNNSLTWNLLYSKNVQYVTSEASTATTNTINISYDGYKELQIVIDRWIVNEATADIFKSPFILQLPLQYNTIYFGWNMTFSAANYLTINQPTKTITSITYRPSVSSSTAYYDRIRIYAR